MLGFVYKGTDETSPLIGHYCRASANETLPTVVLPGTSAWIRMVLISTYPMSGFQMRYKRSGTLMSAQLILSVSATDISLVVAQKPRVVPNL